MEEANADELRRQRDMLTEAHERSANELRERMLGERERVRREWQGRREWHGVGGWGGGAVTARREGSRRQIVAGRIDV